MSRTPAEPARADSAAGTGRHEDSQEDSRQEHGRQEDGRLEDGHQEHGRPEDGPGPHPAPHPRRVTLRRSPLLRRPESLRAIPSLARFLSRPPAEPGGRPASQRRAAADNPAGRGPGRQDPGPGGPGPDPGADDPGADGTLAGRAGPYDTGPDGTSPRGTGHGGGNGWGAAVRARPAWPPSEPQSSAAELRDLAELSDLLAELAGLVHDLGALIVGLMTAATGGGGRQVRTFTIPPELTEMAAAHQDLKTGQQALSARFAAAASDQERAALRGALAALTERATRAVSAAAAAVTPEGASPPAEAPTPAEASPPAAAPTLVEAPVAGEAPSSGRPSGETAPPGESRPQRDDPLGEETGVPSTTGGTPSRWRDAPVADRRLAPVAVALDAPDIDVAAHWATLVTPYVSTVKIGLELYLRYGPAVVATVRGGSGVQVFLDLKLHDIPNTVAGAARAVSKLRPEILTVHAAGGADMIKAAVEAAPDTIVAGVTLLTSMGDKDLAELGIEGTVSDAVRRMAALSVAAGARGLVCSPQEVTAVRAEVGPDILLITPGIRPAGATSDDQARVATPEEALKAGADLLVVGRPITKAADPGAAAAALAVSLRRAVAAP